jgi:penicillin-binding protein 1A
VGFFFFFLPLGDLFGSMPSFEDLENPDSNLATEIISSDGVTIGKFYNENRTSNKIFRLAKTFVDALISTEDERFYEHSGIDGRGTFGAALSLGTRWWSKYFNTTISQTYYFMEKVQIFPF